MEIEYEHILKISKIIEDFDETEDYYPTIIAGPQLIKALQRAYLEYAMVIRNPQTFKILDFYNRNIRTHSYINNNVPEGLMIIKADKIAVHRIFDLPNTEKSRKIISNEVGATIFKKIKFDSDI